MKPIHRRGSVYETLQWKFLKFHSTLPMRGSAEGMYCGEGVHLEVKTHPQKQKHRDTNHQLDGAYTKTHSAPWRPSPGSPPAAWASLGFLRLELETFLLLASGIGPSSSSSSSSSSLLLSFSQAGTALVDLFLNTRPELCGLAAAAAPFCSVGDAETPGLGRPAPRSRSSLRRTAVLLEAGVRAVALSCTGSRVFPTAPARSPSGSIAARALESSSKPESGMERVYEQGVKERIWVKGGLSAGGL